MTNFILALRTALAIIPEVINIVKALEVPGNGSAKLAAVVQIVMEALGSLPTELVSVINASKFGAFIEKVVGIVVSFLNAVGVFKKNS